MYDAVLIHPAQLRHHAVSYPVAAVMHVGIGRIDPVALPGFF